MKTRRELKEQAKQLLARHYWILVLIAFGICVAEGGHVVQLSHSTEEVRNYFDSAKQFIHSSSIYNYVGFGFLIKVFILNPFSIALKGALCHIEDGEAKDYFAQAFSKQSYLRNVVAAALIDLYILAGTLCLFIPGIILYYRYYFADFVLASHPDITPGEAIRTSAAMSKDLKFDFFIFDLSFFLWFIVGGLTFGVGSIVYVNPYYFTAKMCYFRNLVANGKDPLVLTGRW